MTNNIELVPFLREQRDFPTDDLEELAVELDKSYVDIAFNVNSRTISIYPVNVAVNTGESWFLRGQPNRQASLRRVYPFSSTAPIVHGIPFAEVSAFKLGYGSYTDGTNWYGVTFGTTVATAGLLTFYIDPMNIILQLGAGSPAITSGLLVIEWISVQ